MSRRRWNILDTLQGKLVAASALLVVGALILAGTVFVLLTHGKEKERALDHTIAAAPSIHGGFLEGLLAGYSVSELRDYVREAAKRYDVRIPCSITPGWSWKTPAADWRARNWKSPRAAAYQGISPLVLAGVRHGA